MLKAAGDIDQLVGTRLELVADVGDEEIEIAVAADDLLRAAPERGKEIAGLRRGTAIGEAAGERPVGIARIGPVSAGPE